MGLLQSIVARFFPPKRSNSTSSNPNPPTSDARIKLGQEGEALAAKALTRAGYKVLYRNFRGPHGGEVDLVARHGKTLVFVEVKTRRSDTFGAPAEAVTHAKQQLIVRGAVAWLRLLGNPEILIRFDIVEVRFAGKKPTCHIIENAFSPPEALHF